MPMEKIFVDPILHSRRAESIQVLVFGAVMAAIVLAIWTRWSLGGRGMDSVRSSLMLSSLVAAGFGVGYYMLKKNRRVMMDRAWLTVGDEGISSATPAGEVEFSWPEITEVMIASRPTRNKMPDIIIKTGRGSIGAFMRWVEKSETMPEPLLRAPGVLFISPGGGAYRLGPDSSALVKAIREHVPPEKIKEGAIISL